MAQQIHPYSLVAPGYLGVNTQDSPVDLDTKFSIESYNTVIDKFGRVGSRKGWDNAHSSNSDLSTNNIECIGEVLQTNGTRTIVAAGGGYLFKLSGSTLVTLTYGGGGVAPTISANNWQFVTLNGIGIFFQRGYDPLIYDPAVSTTTFRRLSEKGGYTGSVPQANCALSAYGRIWCADTSTDKNTVTWSDIIAPQLWTAGTSGSLNLQGVWPNGADEIVGLAAHNGFLFIFGYKQTLIYSGAEDPASMSLSDTLNNVGCIARDSIQNTGDDVVFLSDSGVRSLTRTIQEKSAPLRGLSKNVYNDIQTYIASETGTVKSGYSPTEAFYLITFPTSLVTLCFDMRSVLPDGSSRVTVWRSTDPKSFCYSVSRTFYLGQAGYIGTYGGYTDNGSSYRMTYYSTWIDFGNPIQTSILKKILMTVIGTTSQSVVVKWGFDYEQASRSQTAALSGFVPAEYGTGEYALSEFSSNSGISEISINASGAGKLVQIGFECEINGYAVSIQKIDIYTKDGRI